MAKKAGLISALLCAVLLFGACSQNINELLRAPALSAGYEEIQKALTEYLGGEEPRYKYPKEGEQRSPMLRADLDGNGQEEAVVLYSVDETSLIGREKGSYVYVAILEYVDGAWQVVWDEPSKHSDVASLEVADLLDDGTRQLIVGYSTSTLNAKSFALYTYGDEELKLQYTVDYSRYEIGDFTGRGVNDLIVVSRDDEPGNLMLHYLPTRDGAFLLDDPSEPVKLDVNFYSCSALVPSTGKAGERLVLVDGVTSAGSLATQVVYYSEEGRFYIIDDAGTMRGATARVNLLLTTRDIDGDGVAEVPLRVGRQEIQTPEGDKHLEYVEWVDFVSGDEPRVKAYGLLDSDRSVFIELPEAWRGQVDVVDGEVNGEWTIQSRRTLANLVSMRVIESGETVPVGSTRVPGTTASYLVVQLGVNEAERAEITMTNMA